MTRRFTRTSPEAEGLDPAAVARLVTNLDALDEIHGFMLLRHGNVVAEGHWAPFAPDRPHVMFSVSKSFTSTAVGLAIEDGLLGLDDLVLDHLKAEAPAEPSANLAAMRVRDLLTMTTGHDRSTMEGIDRTTIGLAGSDWVRQILAMPVPYVPGTTFVYDTGATYLAGVIVQRLTGRRLLDYLRPRLLDPLGITGAAWQQDPDGLDVAGYGLSVTTEDLAAFGQLYLQGGVWEGRQLVPAAWVEAATAKQVECGPHDWVEWLQGYGFQFWRSRFGAYRADGAFGQYAIVWPEHDIVLAVTSGIENTQSVQDAVWYALLPALDPAAAATLPDAGGPRPGVAPPADGVTWDLALRAPQGASTSPLEESLLGVTYTVAGNDHGVESFALRRDGDGRLVLEDRVRGADHLLTLGHGGWVAGTTEVEGGPADVAGAYAWADDSTLEARVHFLGTPFAWTFTLRFTGETVALSIDQNVSFGPTHLLDATGTAQS
ncbi:beta-lactamase family protein [Antribacter sp. KLBMP9083]|uniref:Beta-lactamase family protein n=1 Tax=Antribacter soli TaxID=2910976 RepID=A0AA41UAY2_9MICO|nr:serine hydrolase [Antribacter soli]MCF4123182.1 beta-lactamase family protein [Antribacter soli]